MNIQVNDIGRRELLKRAAQTVVVGVTITNLAGGAVPDNEQIKDYST